MAARAGGAAFDGMDSVPRRSSIYELGSFLAVFVAAGARRSGTMEGRARVAGRRRPH